VSDKSKLNKGFTLVELIIAIAMLAFLMTAVSAFMTSGIISFKKAKADVRVHNSAQENYDIISDAIMEAKDIYLIGYLEGDSTLYCFVRDEEQGAAIKLSQIKSQIGIDDGLNDINTSSLTAKLFDTCGVNTKIYIKALIVDTSRNITKDEFDSLSLSPGTKAHNALTGEDVTIEQEQREDGELVVDRNGNPVYSENETVRHMFIFENENMYYMTKYAYISSNNDNLVDNSSSKLSDFLYSSSFEVIDQEVSDGTSTSSASRTNAVACIDVDNGSMSVDLQYSDKNMTYTTDGMIKTRNSYVLKNKKSVTTTTGDSTEADSPTTEENEEGGEE
jgi:prepilin-type N-terminal cleavage/methylation domain-containing protein